MKLHAYKKDFNYSYTIGAFPTIELLEARPDIVHHVFVSEKYHQLNTLLDGLDAIDIPYDIDAKRIERFTKNTKNHVIGVFDKPRDQVLTPDTNHLVLDAISDMGNFGTIVRTALGLGITNIAVIGNSCDVWHPKSVRASMGAIFKVTIQHFPTLADYTHAFSAQNIYAFMVNDDATALNQTTFAHPYSLVFGNEGKGLDEEVYRNKDEISTVFIEQSEAVDSLNLPNAVSIGLYMANILPKKK